jgi:Icc-related predicted phosphoesterase
MDSFKPKLLVHGHIHLYDRNEPYVHHYKGTTIVNAYGHKVIHYDPKSHNFTLP